MPTKIGKSLHVVLAGSLVLFSFCVACRPLKSSPAGEKRLAALGIPQEQAPGWSTEDLDFFLYGSMSSEFIPERVMKAFLATYPDLFPGGNLAAYGVVQEPDAAWPIGFSRRIIPHLGNQMSIGINCAACHLGEITPAGGAPMRILGRASSLDVYAFFGAVAVAMDRTTQAKYLEKFLGNYLNDPSARKLLANRFAKERKAIFQLLVSDRYGAKEINAGQLHKLTAAEFRLDRASLQDGEKLLPLVQSLLRLFHNSRTALHLPEQLPPLLKTLPGPGRSDAFQVLAAAFFAAPVTFDSPVKYGFTWNLAERPWVHWDGNDRDPMARNAAAALGLGTPIVGQGKLVNGQDLRRQTNISNTIRSPRYPFTVDPTAAARGKTLYARQCAACHNGPEEKRYYSQQEVGTDPNRLRFFDANQAELLNQWTASLQIDGYNAPKSAWRSTQKYFASDLRSVWARSPYLHNASVRTLWDLLTPAAQRPVKFNKGSRAYDDAAMGYVNEGAFLYDTTVSGNAKSGHEYGTTLTEPEKRELLEYLKTL